MKIRYKGWLAVGVALQLLSVLASWPAHAQLYSKFGPVTGVLKGNVASPQTSAAVSSDIIGLWSGCSGSNFLRGDGTCATPTGTGVTSVGLTAPSWYTVTGSPVTSSGTLAITAATGQAANRVIASPDGTTGAISLRALVAGDIPPINLGSTANGGVSSATILLGTNGGTSNGFFSVTGPTTALRTFTFPNASATVLTSNAAVTVAQGGTGVATLTNHGVLLGQGTSNVSAVAAMGLDTLLQGQGASADPAAISINNCGSASTALSYSTSTHTFGCQTISVGGSGTVTNVATGTGLTGGPITTTGTLSVDQAANLTWTGNEVFTTQTFIQTSATNFNPLAICANGQTSGNRCYTWRLGGGGDLLLDIATDAGVPGTQILQAQRSGTAVTGVNLGNATDVPAINGNGVVMTPKAGTFTMTYNGFTAGNSLTATYYCIGNQCTLIIPGSAVATSNATTFTGSGLPAAIIPSKTQLYVIHPSACEDNSVIAGFTCGVQIDNSGSVTFSKGGLNNGWTASNQKGITTNSVITYILN